MSKFTVGGVHDESFWSRGQSWGLYGYTVCYRYTKDKRYLEMAERIADFLLNLEYAEDLIPYWDMLSPDIPHTARDASAAAIMASALLELSQYSCNKTKYYNYAVSIMCNLHEKYESALGKNFGFILDHSTSYYPGNEMIDVPLIYADYYYVEAATRLLKIATNGQ